MYIAFVCNNCGRAQGTYFQKNNENPENKKVVCKLCGKRYALFSHKKPIKIILKSSDLNKINAIVGLYNANAHKVFYDYQNTDGKF